MPTEPATIAHTLAAPWQDPLMARALLEIALVGVAGGALGCWVVLYGLSYTAESMAHSLFPGLVLAALTGVPLIVGGAVGIAVAAVAIALAARVPVLGADTAVAVVVTTLFGAGVLMALAPASPPGLGSLLFGDLLGPSDIDLSLAGVLAVTVGAALWLLHRRFLAVGFDRAAARRLGVATALTDAVLLLLLAAAILVGVQGLGNLLVIAVLIAPAVSARMIARRAGSMIVLAGGLAIAAGAGGLYLSYYAGTAAGASVAGVAVGLCLAVAVVTGLRRRGYDRRRWSEARA